MRGSARIAIEREEGTKTFDVPPVARIHRNASGIPLKISFTG
jgi:hypothetical protein